jgi:hypothetical protein
MQRRALWIGIGLVAMAGAGCAKAADERAPAQRPAVAQASVGGVPDAGDPDDEGSGDDDAGEAFVAPDGEFSIALPEEPQATRTPDGRAVYQLRTDDYAYTVNELDCPADFAGEADPEELYDALQAASVKAVAGTLQSQRDVTSAGEHVAGREFVVHASTPGSGKPFEMVVRLFRVGDSVYLVQAVGPRSEASRDDRQAVVESFAVL